jgi:hypothetical protein
MSFVPSACFPDGAVITVVYRLPFVPSDVRFPVEVVMEDIETLVLTLGESSQPVVKRQTSVPYFLEHGLQNHYIVECALVFQSIHTVEENVRVGDEVMAIREDFIRSRILRENKWAY